MSIAAAIGSLIVLALGVAHVVQYLKSSAIDRANEMSEAERVGRMEAAETAARVARERKFDAKAADVRTTADAARLLRDVSDDQVN